MSESQPKASLPACAAAWITAGESVFCSSTSAPPLSSEWAASVSLGGSNQPLMKTTRTLMPGLMLCAPSVKALMLRSTSGIGTEPT